MRNWKSQKLSIKGLIQTGPKFPFFSFFFLINFGVNNRLGHRCSIIGLNEWTFSPSTINVKFIIEINSSFNNFLCFKISFVCHFPATSRKISRTIYLSEILQAIITFLWIGSNDFLSIPSIKINNGIHSFCQSIRFCVVQ